MGPHGTIFPIMPRFDTGKGERETNCRRRKVLQNCPPFFLSWVCSAATAAAAEATGEKLRKSSAAKTIFFRGRFDVL